MGFSYRQKNLEGQRCDPFGRFVRRAGEHGGQYHAGGHGAQAGTQVRSRHIEFCGHGSRALVFAVRYTCH